MFDTLSTPSPTPSAPALPAPDTYSDADLEEEVSLFASRIAAATCRFLELLAELERREIHFVWGCASCAHYLSLRCGISLGTAHEHLRVARHLSRFPQVRELFARGEISYTKVRAITRVITPDNEEVLCLYARYATGAQLEGIVRAFHGARQAADPHAETLRRTSRFLRYHFEADGSLVGTFRLPPEEGAALVSAIQSARRTLADDEEGLSPPTEPDLSAEDSPVEAQVTDTDLSAEDSPPSPQISRPEPATTNPAHWRHADDPGSARDADALIHVAQVSLARSDPDSTALPLPTVVIHAESGAPQIKGGPHLSAAAAKRLACDAVVASAPSTGSCKADVGRRTRVVPTRLRRALEMRDKGCAFPGCHRRRFTHAHHIHHWSHGGRTDLDNLVLLCGYHHHAVHEGGCTLTRKQDGTLHFANVRGEEIENSVCTRTAHPWELDVSLPVKADACLPLGEGESFDMVLAVDCLLAREPAGV